MGVITYMRTDRRTWRGSEAGAFRDYSKNAPKNYSNAVYADDDDNGDSEENDDAN